MILYDWLTVKNFYTDSASKLITMYIYIYMYTSWRKYGLWQGRTSMMEVKGKEADKRLWNIEESKDSHFSSLIRRHFGD
jgi:hypothetical protein